MNDDVKMAIDEIAISLQVINLLSITSDRTSATRLKMPSDLEGAAAPA